jgi:uncharacterized protein YcbX
MERIGTIETAFRYPVKSMAGEEVDEVFVGFSGIMGDRAYAFVPPGGTKRGFPWHTARQQENLVLYRASYKQPAAATFPVDIETTLAMGVIPIFPTREAFAVEVTTPSGRRLPVDGQDLSDELERQSGKSLTLRFAERGLYDCRPVSLFGNATALALSEEMGKPLDRRRFRANFYADWDDRQPFREDSLVGRTLQIGDRLRIAVLERDPRCKMITLDPDTAEMDAKVLRLVAQQHEGKVGVYAAVLVEGIVRKGDKIWLL